MNYKGVHIDNAHDVVEWCKTHFALDEVGISSRMSQQVPYRVFWEIIGMDVYICLIFMQLSFILIH